jgi:hypothetical protein
MFSKVEKCLLPSRQRGCCGCIRYEKKGVYSRDGWGVYVLCEERGQGVHHITIERGAGGQIRAIIKYIIINF